MTQLTAIDKRAFLLLGLKDLNGSGKIEQKTKGEGYKKEIDENNDGIIDKNEAWNHLTYSGKINQQKLKTFITKTYKTNSKYYYLKRARDVLRSKTLIREWASKGDSYIADKKLIKDPHILIPLCQAGLTNNRRITEKAVWIIKEILNHRRRSGPINLSEQEYRFIRKLFLKTGPVHFVIWAINLLGVRGKNLLKDCFESGLSKRSLNPYILDDFMNYAPKGFYNIILLDPGSREGISQFFQKVTNKTGLYTHWIAFQEFLPKSGATFLMKNFSSLGPNQKLKFIPMWKKLTQNNKGLELIKYKIDAFNLNLMLSKNIKVASAAMKNLNAPIGRNLINHVLKILSGKYRLTYKIGPFRQLLLAAPYYNRLESFLSAQETGIKPSYGHFSAKPISFRELQRLRISGYVQKYKKTIYGTLKKSFQSNNCSFWEVIRETSDILPNKLKRELTRILKQKLKATRAGKIDNQIDSSLINVIAELRETLVNLGVDNKTIVDPFPVIEQRMQSYSDSDHKIAGNISVTYLSESGFLGKGDSLEKTIQQDRAYLTKKGLTHKDLGLPLKIIRDRYFKLGERSFDITINGHKYYVEKVAGPSAQSCPFIDLTENRQPDFMVYEKKTGKKLFFAGLLEHLIGAHGFFEGEHAGTWGGNKFISYRIEPQALIDFFHINSRNK